MKKQRNRSGFKSTSLVGVAIILIGAGLFLAYKHEHKTIAVSVSTGSTSSLTKAAENQQVNQNKASLPAASTSTTQSDTTKNGSTTSTPKTVYIASAYDTDNSVQVSAYLSGVFENGGTCTLTLTKGSQVVTRTDTGIENASYTTCPRFTIDNTNNSVLVSGQWNVVVSYESSTTSGTSQTTTMDVQ